MNGLGFRQTNAWLHTWTGLLLGWLLYAVFVTGTVSFFRDEINYWMKPELHVSQPDADTAQRAAKAMPSIAPGATSWTITLPDERTTAVSVQWFNDDAPQGKSRGKRLLLDAATAEPLAQRDTRGADFLYRFHFELYGMPRIWGRWIVGAATMLMLIAIVSGVVTHKKIFTDFFTFRRRKGQRSWMDAHNALAVLALPFHLVITYSGLLLLMVMLMPWGIQSAYQGDTRGFFSDLRGSRIAEQQQGTVSRPAPMTDLTPLLVQAQSQWPNGVGSISVSAPGTDQSIIELREGKGSSLVSRGRSERMRFDGVSGTLLDAPAQPTTAGAVGVYNVFSSLHLMRFAGPWLRWLCFISGLVGSAMIATGMILWVIKRLPQRRKLGTHLGHRLVECLNVGTIAGLMVAMGVYFWANRLLPAQMAARSTWEISSFFAAWAICLLHPMLRTHRHAWIDQCWAVAILYVTLPLSNLRYPNSHLGISLVQGNWLLASTDLVFLVFAALAALALWFLCKSGAATTLPKATALRPTTKGATA